MPDPVAVYGAVTGTAGALAAAWAVYNGVLRDRARIRARISTGVVQDSPSGKSGEWFWFLEVMNHGRRPVSISSFPGLELPNGRWLVFYDTSAELPKTLDEKTAKVTFRVHQTALVTDVRQEGCMPKRILVKDDAGREYRRRIEGKYLRLLKRLVKSQETESTDMATAKGEVT